MLKPIVVWGASGHAKVLAEFLEHVGYTLIAVFDNDPKAKNPFPGVPLYIGQEGFHFWRKSAGSEPKDCLVAIGGARGKERLKIQGFLASHGLRPAIAVHSNAFVASNATMGSGCQILARAAVAVEVVMGNACIVNTAASVDHESRLGDGVHIAPGATLAGCVSVGDYSLIGPGAVVLPRVRVGTNVIVGAGAVVTRDVPDNRIVYGNPARVVRENPA